MSRHRIALMSITYLALIMLIVTGCTLLGQEEQSGTGVLRVMLTDEPLDWSTVEKMVVTISEVQISRSDDTWKPLEFNTSEVDLLELQNGVFTTLGVTNLAAGTYEQLRLILDVSEPEYNAIVYTDDTFDPFKVPSSEQTGIKIIGPIVIEDGNTTSVLLDFDAQSSVVELGNGDLILKPTITVLDNQVTEGILYFADDFGTGDSDNDIPYWDETEHDSGEDKCMVVEGSPLGGRMARIYGDDINGTNHSFYKRIDLESPERKTLRLEARRSAGWIGTDLVHLELFFGDGWHSIYKFTYSKTETFFTVIELPLTEEMMDTMLYIRFRNGIEDQLEYLDIDNIEIYN